MKTIQIPKEYELVRCEKTGNYSIQKEEFRLEDGKDYVHKERKGFIVLDRVEGDWNVGFFNGEFTDTLICSRPEEWREASEEEVKKALEKEVIRRYGENWENLKIKNPKFAISNNSEFKPMIKKYPDGWRVWNTNGLLYEERKWSEVLEKEEIEDGWYIDEAWDKFLGRVEDGKFTHAISIYGDLYKPEPSGNTVSSIQRLGTPEEIRIRVRRFLQKELPGIVAIIDL